MALFSIRSQLFAWPLISRWDFVHVGADLLEGTGFPVCSLGGVMEIGAWDWMVCTWAC